MLVKILGTGCSKCNQLEQTVREIINNEKLDATVEKITDIQEIMSYGILMTPGLVVNNKVRSYGTIPAKKQIVEWLKEEI